MRFHPPLINSFVSCSRLKKITITWTLTTKAEMTAATFDFLFLDIQGTYTALKILAAERQVVIDLIMDCAPSIDTCRGLTVSITLF